MSSDGNVTEKECKLINEGVKQELARDEKRLNEHGTSIDDLTTISAKLTLIVEMQGKTIEEHTKQIFAAAQVKPWYESDLGKYIVKSFIALLFILLGAAIGLNALDTLQAVQNVKQ
jgi:hypothetical protein